MQSNFEFGMSALSSPEIQAWICGNENGLNKESEDAMMTRLFPQYQNKNRYGFIGEHLFEEYLKLKGIEYTHHEKKNGIIPDFETDECFYEIKTRRYNMNGTAGEKIPGVPFKYRYISQKKPVIIVLVAYQEVEMRSLFNPDERTEEFLEFFRSKGCWFQSFSTLCQEFMDDSEDEIPHLAEGIGQDEIPHLAEDVKPFLKWVGGKGRLLNTLDRTITSITDTRQINRYIEPFLGGGGSFVNALKYGFEEFIAADINQEIIDTWTCVRDNVDDLISELHMYDDMNTKEDYYTVRDDYNRLIHLGAPEREDNVSMAAMFIYLNHTCWRGLYRVNAQNEFNVPYGNYKHYNIDYENLHAVSRAIHNVRFECRDYREIIAEYANENSLLYLDPPYYETGKAYSVEGFDSTQFRDTLNSLTTPFIASNSIDFLGIIDEMHYEIERVSIHEAIHRDNPGAERLELIIKRRD